MDSSLSLFLSFLGGGVLFAVGAYGIFRWHWDLKTQSYISRLEELETKAREAAHLSVRTQQTLLEEREKRIVAEERASRLPSLETLLKDQQINLQEKSIQMTGLEVELRQQRESMIAQKKLLEKAQVEFQDAFKALSAEALSKNNQSFLHLAKTTLERFQEGAKSELKASEKAFSTLVDPVKEALGVVNKRMEEMEKNRVGAYEGLKEQVSQLMVSQKDLRSETANLVNALRAPTVRGRWGEMQLRRVVEMSGMSAHCDFLEQVTLDGSDSRLRPDMIVKLPNNKEIIIDAKVPLEAYLKALESKSDAERISCLKDHARQVKAHINALSSRAYWEQLNKNDARPEFVVLFLPGDSFFSAALEYDPTLIEVAVQKNVIIATPGTLIALLHAVAYGWRQESLAANAREISHLGQELYKRLAGMGGHLSKLGRDLGTAVDSYNKSIGALERRVFPAARRIKELETGIKDDTLTLTSIDHVPRDIQVIELLETKNSA